jgi:hypothetical protein
VIDLRNIFYDMRRISPEPILCRLRGVVCFTESHYVAFFDVSIPVKSGNVEAQWVCCNDERIFAVANPLAECRQHLLQPQLLIYESLEIGEKAPVEFRMLTRASLKGSELKPSDGPAIQPGRTLGESQSQQRERWGDKKNSVAK